jgi:hypothetical protein
MISKMMENYYSDVKQDIIIDREKNWAHPENIKLLKKYIAENPKIIFTTRPFHEILASFIAVNKDNIVIDMVYSGFKRRDDWTQDQNICEYLVYHTKFYSIMESLQSIDDPTNSIHVVKYEDLINTPQETMDKIYNFLEIESFKHNFNNIINNEEQNDQIGGLPKNLHEIRKTLGRSEVKVEDYLSPASIERWKDHRYF